MPGGGTYYQHNDEECHYLQHRAKYSYSDGRTQDYPRRSREEVEHTYNDGGPEAPRFHHPQSDSDYETYNAQYKPRVYDECWWWLCPGEENQPRPGEVKQVQ